MWKKGDRVQYQGQPGTIRETKRVTPGMIDLQLDHEGFVRRAAPGQLARLNGSKPPVQVKRIGTPRMLGASRSIIEQHMVGAQERAERDLAAAEVELARVIATGDRAAAREARRQVLEIERVLDAIMATTLPTTRKKKRGSRAAAEPTPDEQMAALVEETAKYSTELGLSFDPDTYFETWKKRYKKDWKKKLLTHFTDKARGLKRLVGNQREANRVHKLTGKPTDAIRGMVTAPKGTPTVMDRAGIGVFTRPDPPRLGAKGHFCGNAIDGTGYFIAVSNARGQTTEFVHWAQLFKAARGQGLELARVSSVGPRRRDGSRGPLSVARTRSALLFGELGHSADTTKQEGFLTTHLLNLRNKPEARPYLQIIQDMVSAGVRVKLPSGSRTLAGLEVRHGGEGAWQLIPQPNEGTDVRINRGDDVRIVIPSVRLLRQLTKFYHTVYSAELRDQGFRVFEHREKARRPAGIKKGVKARRGRKEPRAEDLATTRGSGTVTYTASAGTNFAYLGEDNVLAYPRLRRDMAPSVEKMALFRPYGGPTKQDKHTWENITGNALPVRAALLALSKRKAPAVSAAVADRLIASGLVQITIRVPKTRGGEEREVSRMTVAAADDVLYPGEFIHVWAEQKANSPYFGWVRDLTAAQTGRGTPYAKCLTPVEEMAYGKVTTLIRGLRGLRNQFISMQQVYQKLRDVGGDEKLPTWNVNKTLRKLGKALKTVDRERQQLFAELEEDPSTPEYQSAVLVIRMIGWTPTAQQTFPPPLALFRIENGQWADEPDSLLSLVLDRAHELGLISLAPSTSIGDVTTSEMTEPAQQRRLLNELWGETLRRGDLGVVGLRFLRGETYRPFDSVMVRAMLQAGIGDVPEEPAAHPLDDFYSWLLKVTQGMGAYPKAATQLAQMRAGADLRALTSSSPPRKDGDKRQAAWAWGEALRVYVTGGQTTARSGRRGETKSRTILRQKSGGITASGGRRVVRGGAASKAVPQLVVVGDGTTPRIDPQSGKPLVLQSIVPRPGITFEEQIDRNDTLTLLLTSVYKRRRFEMSPADRQGTVLPSRKENLDPALIEMMLLTYLYYDLGGYEMSGSLGVQKAAGSLDEITVLESKVTDLLGGRALGSSPTEGYTVYKTYNPVLFEMTRLFWPTKDGADPRWKGFLANSKTLDDFDAVGRYGVAAGLMQRAVLVTASEDEVAQKLATTLVQPLEIYTSKVSEMAGTPSVRGLDMVSMTQLMLFLRTNPTVIQAMAQEATLPPEQVNAIVRGGMIGFDLLWPLGADVMTAFKSLQSFTAAPTAGLRQLKLRAGRAAPRLLSVREASLPPRTRTAKEEEQGLGTTILTEPYIQAALSAGSPLDPRESDDEAARDTYALSALAKLRRALEKATGTLLYAGVDDTDLDHQPGSLTSSSRRKTEIKALQSFQKKPGTVRRRVKGAMQTVALHPTRATGLYDPATILNLAKVEMSPPMPPGEREYGGQTSTPWLLRSGGKDKDIYQGSMLAQVEGSRGAAAGWIRRIDDLLADLEPHTA
jgi:hypothetical protein